MRDRRSFRRRCAAIYYAIYIVLVNTDKADIACGSRPTVNIVTLNTREHEVARLARSRSIWIVRNPYERGQSYRRNRTEVAFKISTGHYCPVLAWFLSSWIFMLQTFTTRFLLPWSNCSFSFFFFFWSFYSDPLSLRRRINPSLSLYCCRYFSEKTQKLQLTAV